MKLTNFSKAIFTTALLSLVVFSAESHARTISRSFKGKLNNTTMIPNSDVTIVVDIQCLQKPMGKRVCPGTQPEERILVPVNKAGEFIMPELTAGLTQGLKVRMNLQVANGLNLALGSRTVGKQYPYEYWSDYLTLGSYSSLGDYQWGDFDNFEKENTVITLEGFAPANLKELTVDGKPMAEVFKNDEFIRVELKVFMENDVTTLGYATTTAYLSKDSNGSIPALIIGHSDAPYSNFKYEVRAEGMLADKNGQPIKKFNFNPFGQAGGIEKGQKIFEWPFNLKTE